MQLKLACNVERSFAQGSMLALGLHHQAHVCRSYLQSSQQPRLYYKAGALGKLVVEQCPLLNSIYWPSPLAFSRDAQTCVTGAAVHNSGNYTFQKHMYKLRIHIGLIRNCVTNPLSPLLVQRGCRASQDVSAVNAVSGSRQLKMHRAYLIFFLAVLRQLTIRSRFTRELRAMHDGGCIALDWWRDHQTAPRFAATTPIVLVLHGLSGAPLLLPYCAAHPCMQRRLHALRHY